MDNIAGTGHAPPETSGLRLGVIGAGWFDSRRHLPEACKHPDVKLTALCRRDPEARATMAMHFGVPPEHAHESWEEMLEREPLDAVLIATPNALHYTQARAALERGLHVLLEKPMCVHVEEARALTDLARSEKRVLTVALNPPFWAHCHRIRSVLRHGRLGTLESVCLYWSGTADAVFGRAPLPDNLPGVVQPTLYRADPKLNGGGYFIDGGSHLVSELLWVTGLRARKVSALFDTTPSDMRAAISIELENGVPATINAIGNSRYNQRRVRNLFGASDGFATVTGFDFDTAIHIPGEETQHFREADLPLVESPLVNFVNAILHGKELCSSPEHGMHVVEVVEAAYQSAATGRTVVPGV